jgi:release factor glutamine methyltransferase
LVSNPPYIPASEASSLAVNVRKYEPSIALFVPADDPLLFYRSLALFAVDHLIEPALLYCEVASNHAERALHLIQSTGLHAQLFNDSFGLPRIIKASRYPF